MFCALPSCWGCLVFWWLCVCGGVSWFVHLPIYFLEGLFDISVGYWDPTNVVYLPIPRWVV